MEELLHSDRVLRVLSTGPSIQHCVELEKLGWMRHCGNQYNPDWDWVKSVINSLTDDQLDNVYKYYKRKSHGG